MIYNDYPITDIESDKLGRVKFANRVAEFISRYKENDSIVIGICGEWGSGKTSTLNLIEQEIRAIDQDQVPMHRNVIIRFNPWNFSSQDQLLEQFFNFLKKTIGNVIVDYPEIFYKFGIVCENVHSTVRLFGFVPIVGNLFSLLNEYSKILKDFKNNKSLDEIKNKINKKLEKQKRRFIIFIDDIDRLNDQEIVQLFQLVKLVANFKNVIYVLSFDKKVVVKALAKGQSEFANEYLEKIVQVPFSLPAVSKKKIREILFENLESLIKDLDIDESRFRKSHLIGIYDSFLTLRDVKRFINNFEFNYIPLKHEVDFVDFFIIKYFEVFFSDVYNKLQSIKNILIGTFPSYYNISDKDKHKQEVLSAIDDLLSNVKYHEQKLFIRSLLNFLFPRVNALQFQSYHIETEYLKDRYTGRIYIEEKFNLYFGLDISLEDVSTKEMSEIIAHFDDHAFAEYIMKLFKLDTLYVFIQYIYLQLKNNSNIPYNNVILQLLKNLYATDNFLTYPLFGVSNHELVLDLTCEYLHKQETEKMVLDLFEKMKDSLPLGVFCNVVNWIGFYIGKYGNKKSNDAKINISMLEFQKIEDKLSVMVFDRLKSDLSTFQPKEFSDMLHFLCNYDCNSLCNWVKNNIKNEQNLIIQFLKLSMRNGILDSDKRYITYGFPSDILTNVILPMDWDELIKSFITSDDFEKADRDTQKAAIVYFWNKDGKINATDSEIDDFYKKEFIKS